MSAQHEIVHDGGIAEKLDVLECPRHSFAGNGVRTQADKIIIFEENPARIGFVNAADHVEDGGLPASVRPDNGEYFVGWTSS